MKALLIGAVALLGALSALPAGAQALIHRYSFNGSANDSVGTAHGSVVGNVTFDNSPGVNGQANFHGGNSNASPSYISLPTSVVSGLQNATIEIFTTGFTAGNQPAYEALFDVSSVYPNNANYAILGAFRSGSGIGIGSRTDSGAETTVPSTTPLPNGNHVITLVYSGFTGIGSTGMETLYMDGTPLVNASGQTVTAATVFSLAKVASGVGGIGTVGIGGGSPFNDPTFNGSMNEVRIYNDALSPAQITADVNAGPADLGFTLPLQAEGAAVTPVTDTRATVGWTSSNVTDTVVDYGPTTAYGSTATGAGGTLTHSVTLAGLQPSTAYHYRARSRDIFGQTMMTLDGTFTTAPASKAQVVATRVTSARTGTGQIMVTVTLSNVGTADALNAQVSSAKLGTAAPLSVLPMTVGMGKISQGGTATVTLNFASQAAGATVIFNMSGTHAAGAFSASSRVRLP